MFVPFVSSRAPQRRAHTRRQTAGGSASSGGNSDSSGSTTTSASDGPGQVGGGIASSGSFGGGVLLDVGGKRKVAASNSNGSTREETLPANHLFAGRTVGGGTRDQIYGTSAYGSGYPGVDGKGTAGRGFPFYFWPVSFGSGTEPSYIYPPEYGPPSNASRPGGRMTTMTLTQQSTNDTLRIISDHGTVDILGQKLQQRCSSHFATPPSGTRAPYEGSGTSLPAPEHVIQYYRGSSVALALDGYNNSATFSEDDSTPNTALPTIDADFLNCINSTIGSQVPLVTDTGSSHGNGSSALSASLVSGSGLVGSLSLVLAILSML